MFETTHLLSNFEELSAKKWTRFSLNHSFCLELKAQAQTRLARQQFHNAQLAFLKTVESKIRNDKIYWLSEEQNDLTISEKKYLQKIDFLRLQLRNFFRISLTNFETHFAFYESGHFYQRHRDTTSQNNQRVFSFVLYLNECWQPEDGGELVGYDASEAEIFKIQPHIGEMILFQSDLEHEVMPTKRDRFSLTGWMRR